MLERIANEPLSFFVPTEPPVREQRTPDQHNEQPAPVLPDQVGSGSDLGGALPRNAVPHPGGRLHRGKTVGPSVRVVEPEGAAERHVPDQVVGRGRPAEEMVPAPAAKLGPVKPRPRRFPEQHPVDDPAPGREHPADLLADDPLTAPPRRPAAVPASTCTYFRCRARSDGDVVNSSVPARSYKYTILQFIANPSRAAGQFFFF